jgi:hypothetical protein
MTAKKEIKIEGYTDSVKTQAGMYALLKSMGQEPNPKSLKITPLTHSIDGKKAWIFPDGSKMVYLDGAQYMEVEELK